MSKATDRSCTPKADPKGRSVSLPVVEGEGERKIKKSKSAPWRALVLTLVNLAMAGHIVMWMVQGMGKEGKRTLAPVEPSESMYTMETGIVNAGFIFFVAAMLATLVLGRLFCGWGCHVISLQDFCGWLMKKMGVHPKPFRTRLMIWAPFILALYMFVWPTFVREVLRPGYLIYIAEPAVARELDADPTTRDTKPRQWFNAAYGPGMYDRGGDEAKKVAREGYVRAMARDRWNDLAVTLMIADPPPRPEQLGVELFVEDFWKTFAPWPVAIPFFFVCGFAIVYFLGNKAFCSFGCPYGGFFGVIDRFTPARIKVSDACNHCGHCTATCTSNVRVHEEVRDYGMVVDPGCMKCLDCVSVCPNDALSYGYAKPSILAKPRTPEAAERRRSKAKNYDLTWIEDLWVGFAFFALIWCFRLFLGQVPLLMAMALGAMGAFFLWKLVCMIRTPNVRLAHGQLRARGKVTMLGGAFAAFTLVYLGAAAWGGYVKWHHYRAEVIDSTLVKTASNVVFGAGYTPDPADAANADRAIAHYLRAAAPREGGVGWPMTIEQNSRVAWLHAVAGRLDQSEKYQRRVLELRRSIQRGEVPTHDLFNLGMLMGVRGATPEMIEAEYEAQLALSPKDAALHSALAAAEADQGRLDRALPRVERARAMDPWSEQVALDAAKVYLTAMQAAGDRETANRHAAKADEILAAGVKHHKHSDRLRAMQAASAAIAGKTDEAIRHLKAALEIAPRNTMYHRQLAQAYRTSGRDREAEGHEERALQIEKERRERR